jgi:hypothetical protein
MYLPNFIASHKPVRSVRCVLAAVLFWPLFLAATIVEERLGLTWLATTQIKVWLPVAAIWMFACVVGAMIKPAPVISKLLAGLLVLLSFAASYALVVTIGAKFFNWWD